NLKNLARAKKCEVSDLVACMLDRDRHKELIANTRGAGAGLISLSTGERPRGVARSPTGRGWIWRETEDRIGLGIAQRLGLPEILGRLLAVRGVDADAAAGYLDPTLRALLPDPS